MWLTIHRWPLLVSLSLLATGTAGVVRPASGAQGGAEQCIPQQAVLVAQIPAPQPLLDLAFDPNTLRTAASVPGFEAALAHPGLRRAQQVTAYLATQLGMDWRTGLGKLIGGGVTRALLPRQAVLVVIDSSDATMLAQLNDLLVKSAAADAPKRERVKSSVHEGVTCWSLGEAAHYAILDGRLVLSNRFEALKLALDLQGRDSGSSLAEQPGYQAAKQAATSTASEHASGWVYLDLALLKQIPKLEAALAQNANPLATLLSADLTEALRQSKWLALRWDLSSRRLALIATVDGLPAADDASTKFATPRDPQAGALPNLVVPRRLAAASLYRDLSGFYANKERLFPERTSGLVFFENMMAIFFTGRDLTREVLAEVEPEVRLVAAQQQYDPATGKPQPEVPAFAAVFRIKHPQTFGEVAEEAWQKALGLANFTRGQKAQPGLILDKASHGDVRYSLAYFSAAEEEDRSRLDTRFNFRPTLVKLGEYLILSSSDGLAKDLIDTIQQEAARPPQPLATTHSVVEVDAAVLAAMLRANREPLVRNSMLKKGLAQEQAEAQFDLVVSVIQRFRGAKLLVDSPAGQTRAVLELDWTRP